MNRLACSVILGISAFIAQPSVSLTFEEAQDIVDYMPESISYTESNHGALCEILALEKLSEYVSSDRLMGGVKYGTRYRIYGELDVVVMNEDYSAVSHIIEVKCSKKYRSAYNKAQYQLERISGYANDCGHQYYLPEGQIMGCEMFKDQEISYLSMSYADALSSGFELSLDLTRAEVIDLIRN